MPFRAFDIASRVLGACERIVFLIVGALLFFASLALAYRCGEPLIALFGQPSSGVVAAASYFLNLVLLILMITGIAYTVKLSLRGRVLDPAPFLIVGLIAIIRRILLLTVQQAQSGRIGAPAAYLESANVAILTFVVLVFVFSIFLLRRRHES
ncbi:MAG TPA: phosphate-starvation-inducible PsiE family protein [Candidatus Baltobacteraceae bacterium]|nr:phosphate-starvation-inducible PsiE family protein [Candidatus Baltobacteraceae bacterium]